MLCYKRVISRQLGGLIVCGKEKQSDKVSKHCASRKGFLGTVSIVCFASECGFNKILFCLSVGCVKIQEGRKCDWPIFNIGAWIY